MSQPWTRRQRQTGARRLRRHAKFIAALPHSGKLKMDVFIQLDAEGNFPSLHHCQTAACIVGWLPISERRDWEFLRGLPRLRSMKDSLNGPGGSYYGAEKWFYLTIDECYDLFRGGAPHQTPKAAATALNLKAQSVEAESQ